MNENVSLCVCRSVCLFELDSNGCLLVCTAAALNISLQTPFGILPGARVHVLRSRRQPVIDNARGLRRGALENDTWAHVFLGEEGDCGVYYGAQKCSQTVHLYLLGTGLPLHSDSVILTAAKAKRNLTKKLFIHPCPSLFQLKNKYMKIFQKKPHNELHLAADSQPSPGLK